MTNELSKSGLRAVFVDATPTLTGVARRLRRESDIPIGINENPDVKPQEIPAVLDGAGLMIIDHTYFPMDIAAQCPGLKDVVFLGTGAASYMDIDALERGGIRVHLIRGYGDTAVAECAFAHMWEGAKRLSRMDRGVRDGNWLRTEGMQLTGKTLGLIGFGGIGKEMARLAKGCGMTVIAWNRTPRVCEGVAFVSIDELLESSHVISMHLLLSGETRGFLSRERIATMRPGAILVNTARGDLVNEEAMIEALRSGKLSHAGLDVFHIEPLPAGHPLTTLPNVTLSAHSAFRTPEANDNLIEAALEHCRRIASGA